MGTSRGTTTSVGLTVYELLALAFGVAAVVWLVRRREPFGIVLAAWVAATLVMYTVATEKMPWLLVNITVPLALAAGMLPWSSDGPNFLGSRGRGGLASRRGVWRSRRLALRWRYGWHGLL